MLDFEKSVRNGFDYKSFSGSKHAFLKKCLSPSDIHFMTRSVALADMCVISCRGLPMTGQ